jgi:uncharacterized protein
VSAGLSPFIANGVQIDLLFAMTKLQDALMSEQSRKYDGFVPGAFSIDSYGAGGFRFADMSHRGSIIVLPSGVHIWNVTSPAELTPDVFQPVFDEQPGSLEMLLIGTGRELLPIRADVRARFKEAGIGIDLMATRHAIATYNILFEEKRRVGAALIAVP